MRNYIKEKIVTLLKKDNNIDEIKCVVLEYNQTHIELDVINKVLSYKYVISPTRGGDGFPQGYFDTYYTQLNEENFTLCKVQIGECLKRLPFEKELQLLPPGANRKAFLWYVDVQCNEFYYSSEPIHKEFTNLYELLFAYSKFCE